MTYKRSHLLPKYPLAINSLGELICPGCGAHFAVIALRRRVPAYCSKACADRVWRRGGRLTRERIRAMIGAAG